MTEEEILEESSVFFSTTTTTTSNDRLVVMEDPTAASRSPYQVLGLAMVVDLKGKGARMMLRYPVQPPPSTSASPMMTQSSSEAQNAANKYSASATPSLPPEDPNLFFRLPPRQMAKLFRPKPALCGQPMTLSVGGTVFCCCAALLETPSTNNNNNNNNALAENEENNNAPGPSPTESPLVLFSVIVALAPQVKVSSIPITGWLEGESSSSSHSSSTLPPRPSASFLCIRRVHVSLQRLCRVLEREERRCRYVSIQAAYFHRLRHELRQTWRQTTTSPRGHHHDDDEEDAPLAASDDEGPPGEDTLVTPSPSLHPPNHPGSSSSRLLAPSTSDSAGNSPVALVTKGNHTTTTTTSAAPLPVPKGTSTVSPPSTTVLPGSIERGRHSRSNSFSSVAHASKNQLPEAPPSQSGGILPSGSLNHHQQQQQHHHHHHHQAHYQMSAEQLQELLEIMMAAPPPRADASLREPAGPSDDCQETEAPTDRPVDPHAVYYPYHHGNLARELVQVFHALARYDHPWTPSPAALLSGQDALVYINRHLAVAIEAAAPAWHVPFPTAITTKYLPGQPNVKPYQTLLFPTASPGQLLASLSGLSAGPMYSSLIISPRRLQQFLRVVHPQKSLAETASEANLPLTVTLELASSLIEQGVCGPSPVLSRTVRLASVDHRLLRHHQVSLAFVQTFGTSTPLLLMVAFLTENRRTLGEAMALVSVQNNNHLAVDENDDDSRLEFLKSCLRECLPMRRGAAVVGTRSPAWFMNEGSVVTDETYHEGTLLANKAATHSGLGLSNVVVSHPDQAVASARVVFDEMEDLVYQMALWLCAQGILVQLQEYLVEVPLSARNSQLSESMHAQGATRSAEPLSQSQDEPTQADDDNSDHDGAERKLESMAPPPPTRTGTSREDAIIFQELKRCHALRGTTSLPACSWRTGLDEARIRSWAAHQRNVRLISRIPAAGDDLEEM